MKDRDMYGLGIVFGLIAMGATTIPHWPQTIEQRGLFESSFDLTRYLPYIEKAEKDHKLPPRLLEVLARMERSENVGSNTITTHTYSPWNLTERRIMQMAQATGRDDFKASDISNASYVTDLQAQYLEQLLAKYQPIFLNEKGTLRASLIAYYAGEGTVDSYLRGGNMQLPKPVVYAADRAMALLEQPPLTP